MYGSLVIAYLFLGGGAAGALAVISAGSLAFRARPRGERINRAFHALRTRVYVVALLLLVLAMLCLLWDLGNPARALLVFLRPHPTVITFGAYSLALEALIAAVLAATHLFGRPRLSQGGVAAVEALCCAGGVAVMAYTGVFLMGGGIPAWNSGWLVGLFVCSSLSAGVSIVLLIDWFTQGQTVLLHAAKPLQVGHLVCLACEALCLVAFTASAFGNPDAQGSVDLLLADDMAATALIGVVGMGIVLPALLETYSLTRRACRTIPVSDALCLVGGLYLRFVIIACGVH